MRYLALILLFFTLAAEAQTVDVYAFDQAKQSQQFQSILKQLRCLVCQNQDLADSNAPLANDLKNQIHQMIVQHDSNEKIIAYLTARYGEFILFSPPVTARTYILWFAPFLFLMASIAILLFIITKRQPTEARAAP